MRTSSRGRQRPDRPCWRGCAGRPRSSRQNRRPPGWRISCCCCRYRGRPHERGDLLHDLQRRLLPGYGRAAQFPAPDGKRRRARGSRPRAFARPARSPRAARPRGRPTGRRRGPSDPHQALPAAVRAPGRDRPRGQRHGRRPPARRSRPARCPRGRSCCSPTTGRTAGAGSPSGPRPSSYAPRFAGRRI